MKRLFLLTLFLLVSSLFTWAHPVDVDVAMSLGRKFVANNFEHADKPVLRISYTAVSESGTPVYYVFDVADFGFLVMSADDCAHPVLGYCENNNFDYDKAAPGLKAMLSEYFRAIVFAVEHDIQADAQVAAEWSQLAKNGRLNNAKETQAVGPLVQTKWDQSPYYNALCPGNGDDKAVTGCVATAMAQLLKYHNYPDRGTSSHTYQEDDYGELSVDFGATTYDWNNMPNKLSAFSNETQVNAVATLMYHCGVSVDMDYSPTGSGAPSANVALALNAYFDYPQVTFATRYDPSTGDDNYVSQTDWDNILKAQFDAGHPVYYAGYNITDTSSAGHAFVCDGYTNNLFHFNFGWSGHSDGYYATNALNLEALGMSFNSLQEMVYDIYPLSHPTPPVPPAPDECVVLHEEYFDSNTPLSIYLAGQDVGGYLLGSNGNGDKAAAEIFAIQGTALVTEVKFSYCIVGPAGDVTFKVWTGTAINGPTTEVFSQSISMQQLYEMARPSDDNSYRSGFCLWPLDVPVLVSDTFFVGCDVSAAGDYIGLCSTSFDSGVASGSAWRQTSDGHWEAVCSSPEQALTAYLLPTVCSVASASLSVSPAFKSFGASSGQVTIGVISTDAWTANSSVDWLTVEPSSGNGNGSFVITCDANSTTSSRMGEVAVSGPTGVKTVTIMQAALSHRFAVSPTTQSFDAAGGQVTIDVICTDAWTVTPLVDWLTIEPSSGNGNGSFVITCEANSTTSSRMGEVEVSGPTGVKTITISQAAGETTDILEAVVSSAIVYPNPVKDILNIRTGLPIRSVQILNVVGNLVKDLIGNNDVEMSVQVGDLSPSIYVVCIFTDDKVVCLRFRKQ